MRQFHSDGERIYHLWDEYARTLNVDGLLSLYAPDATLETPVINAIFDTDCGVLRGHAELRHFFEEGGRRRPNALVRWYRRPGQFQFDGQRLTWEYPREAPDGDQIDIVEVMDLSAGLIRHHRIYWGWFGIQRLIQSALKATGR
ncbi:MAG TPA: nuclear transport factor 2 family protein [Gammaproteobacteria bacterium]|nr:nuclear transport factor 2 family protein [Gammaproteobacteria bacterium]